MINKKAKFIDHFKHFFVLFLGTIIAAAGLELFLIPNHVIDGGIVGISIMASYLTDLPLGVFLVVLNIPFVFIGYKHIGRLFAISTIFSIISLSFWSSVFLPLPVQTTDPVLAAIFGGIITGLGVGLIIRNGGSLDGTEIVAIIVDKRSSYSVGEVVMFINLFILSSAAIVYNPDQAMYSLLAYYVIAKVIDVVQKGMDQTYAVMLVSDKHEEIASRLMAELGRGVTYLTGEGAYTGAEKKVVFCVVTRLELTKLKEIATEEDESVFITINSVQEIMGGRFKKTGH